MPSNEFESMFYQAIETAGEPRSRTKISPCRLSMQIDFVIHRALWLQNTSPRWKHG